MSLGPILSLDLRRHAAARPLAPAVVDAVGVHAWHDIDRMADVAAAGLQAAGVTPGDRVALLTAPSAGAVALLAAVARAGAIAAPLGLRLTGRELAAAVAATAPWLLVHDDDRAADAAGLGVRALPPAELVARAGAERPRGVQLDPAAPAVAVSTSGTTGRPRAALLSHAALAASAVAWTAALPPAAGWLLALEIAHVAGLGVIWRAVGAGVTLRVVFPFDAAAVHAALRALDAPTHVSVVPAQLARLLEAAPDDAAPPALRAVLLGGAPIPPDLVRRAAASGWPVLPTYGLTEAGSGVTALAAEEAAAHPGSAGRPLPGVAVRVAEPGPDGVGEIEVLTPALASGYLDMAAPGREAPAGDASAQAAPSAGTGDDEARGARADDPAGDADAHLVPLARTAGGWLRTGDLGRLDAAARLFVVDRRADLVVSGGENVAPAEVEAVLEGHPAVAEAGVAPRPDPRWGQVPVAAIVLRDGADDPGDDALRAWCRERLAPAKVPAAFVRRATLPRTASGKLRRGELRDELTPLVVVLHATLSTGRQLAPLARELAAPGDLRVVAPDRRGSGTRRVDPPRPVDLAEHLADLEELLDGEGAGGAVLVGHSFGGVVALEAAVCLPDRVRAVVAYEPPYGPVADDRTRRAFGLVAERTARAAAVGGAPAAARAFMTGIGGPGAWAALPERTRAFLEDEGGGAAADAAMTGVDAVGLGDIACPVAILTGGASEPFYAPLADALAARIPGARRVHVPGLRHTAPITEPATVAVAVREALAAAGVVVAPLPPQETSA